MTDPSIMLTLSKLNFDLNIVREAQKNPNRKNNNRLKGSMNNKAIALAAT